VRVRLRKAHDDERKTWPQFKPLRPYPGMEQQPRGTFQAYFSGLGHRFNALGQFVKRNGNGSNGRGK